MSNETASEDSTPVVRFDDPAFSPLDSSQLNDLRKRVVQNKDVSDEELAHAIQTKLYEQREQQLESSKKDTSKTTRQKLDPNLLDDLLNTPT